MTRSQSSVIELGQNLHRILRVQMQRNGMMNQNTVTGIPSLSIRKKLESEMLDVTT